MVINHPLSASSIFYDPWHPDSFCIPDILFPQSLSKFSLVYLLARHPPLYTPHISSPNHCLLFAAHAYTIATCFAAVPRLCHLILVSLSTLYLELCPFSSLPTEVPSHFPFLRAMSHFHAIYYFAQNCCTIFLSLSMVYPYW